MTNDITLTFSKEALAGIFCLAQMGIISADLNARIKDVILKKEDGNYVKEYYKFKDDWKGALDDARSIVADEKTSIVHAFTALDTIQAELAKAFAPPEADE